MSLTSSAGTPHVACFILFFLVANPMTYDLTSKLPLGPMNLKTKRGSLKLPQN